MKLEPLSVGFETVANSIEPKLVVDSTVAYMMDCTVGKLLIVPVLPLMVVWQFENSTVPISAKVVKVPRDRWLDISGLSAIHSAVNWEET